MSAAEFVEKLLADMRAAGVQTLILAQNGAGGFVTRWGYYSFQSGEDLLRAVEGQKQEGGIDGNHP